MQQEDQNEASFFARWFGFAGWRKMSASARIATQIAYRVFFMIGLAGLIIGYGTVTGSDPGGLAILTMVICWYLLFQVMVNFVFIEGSR